MKFVTGVDLIEIARVEDAIARHGDRFLNRIFTRGEIESSNGKIESLAARFAAKEAAAKALGEGIGEIGWQEIEVVVNGKKAPALRLYGKAGEKANELGIADWSISLSHSQSHAIAFVVGLGN